MTRFLHWFCLICIVCSLHVRVGYGQCLSALQLQARVDSAKRNPGVKATRLLETIRQQLVRNGCPRDSMFARVMMQLGYARYLENDVDSAIVLFSQSIDIFSQQVDRQQVRLVAAYFYRGQAYQTLTNDAQAEASYLTCIRLGGSKPEHDKMVGYAMNGQSLLCYKKGDYEAGLSYAEQAINRAQRCHDRQLEARCLNESARNLLHIGDYTRALRYINRATTLVDTDPTLANDRKLYELFRAQAMVGLKQFPMALRQFEQVLAYYEQSGQPDRVAHVCSDIGDLYATRLGKPAIAQTYYKRAYGLFANPNEKSRMLQSIGNTLRQTGHHRAALTMYQRALQTLPIQFNLTDVRANPKPASIRVSTYKEYLLTLVWDKADTWLDYAKTVAQPQPYLKQALLAYQVADQMIDQMRWEQSGQQSKLYWRQQTRAFYEHALETCYRLGDTEQALHFFEKSRAVLLSDKINELGASQALSTAQQAREQQLRQAVDRRLATLAQLTPGTEPYTKARTDLRTEQERSDAFVRQLEHSSPAYYRYKYDNRVTSLSELQQYLDRRQASFVSYFVGDSALYTLGVEADKAQLLRQPLGTYQKNSRAYLSLLSQPGRLNQSFTSFLSLSHRLYEQLLAPLHLPTGRVIVSPDGPFIPFETLSQSPKGLAYALDSFSFSYAYSARLLLRQSKGRTGGTPVGDFLGVAPGRFAPVLGQAALPGSERVLQTIGAGFRSPLLLTGPEATRRAFQDAAPLYRVVHLFTHATANREPQLYFADSTLPLSELSRGMMSHVQLVTLAACETGAGVDQEGEGVFSLARGFAASGVPSVMTTLWSVQNEATYQITSQFYQHLADGLPKDVALQRARLDWIKNADGADLLPSAWAGLILVGDAEPLAADAHRELMGGLSGLLLGGLLQVGWRRWRRRR